MHPPGRPRLHGAVDVRPNVRYNYRRAERIKSNKAEGNNMASEANCSDRHFFMTIVPTNTSGEGDPACKLVVIEHICVISEPIKARNANDMDALDRARVQVAQRLGVPVENVEY